MEKLDKAYEAIELLKELELPISSEQFKAIKQMERQYLREEVIPQVSKEIEPLMDQMQNKFSLLVTCSHEKGLDIQIMEKQTVQENQSSTTLKSPKGQAKFLIRVIFPDGHVSCNRVVWETLAEVVKFAGIDRVRGLGIMMFGDNFITKDMNSNEIYRSSQKYIGEGYYLTTCSPTDTKYDQIRKINIDLGLGLRIEKVLL